MNYWLMKSEPNVYSIMDLARQKTGIWDGVRNYAARNFMRAMRPGDQAFFYHSSAEPSGIAGTLTIARGAFADPSQFNPKNIHFDPKSKKENPTWVAVEVAEAEIFSEIISLERLRQVPALKEMILFKRGRLSVQPVKPNEWRVILDLASKKSA